MDRRRRRRHSCPAVSGRWEREDRAGLRGRPDHLDIRDLAESKESRELRACREAEVALACPVRPVKTDIRDETGILDHLARPDHPALAVRPVHRERMVRKASRATPAPAAPKEK